MTCALQMTQHGYVHPFLVLEASRKPETGCPENHSQTRRMHSQAVDSLEKALYRPSPHTLPSHLCHPFTDKELNQSSRRTRQSRAHSAGERAESTAHRQRQQTLQKRNSEHGIWPCTQTQGNTNMQHTCPTKLQNTRSSGRNHRMHELPANRRIDAQEGPLQQLVLTAIGKATSPRTSTYAEGAHGCLTVWCTRRLLDKGHLWMAADARHGHERHGNCQQA